MREERPVLNFPVRKSGARHQTTSLTSVLYRGTSLALSERELQRFTTCYSPITNQSDWGVCKWAFQILVNYQRYFFILIFIERREVLLISWDLLI
jgi:hypothetical protein